MRFIQNLKNNCRRSYDKEEPLIQRLWNLIENIVSERRKHLRASRTWCEFSCSGAFWHINFQCIKQFRRRQLNYLSFHSRDNYNFEASLHSQSNVWLRQIHILWHLTSYANVRISFSQQAFTFVNFHNRNKSSNEFSLVFLAETLTVTSSDKFSFHFVLRDWKFLCIFFFCKSKSL